jgi:hypothetical protein
MTVLLPNLIEALRHELQQYGEILALLDQQHEAVKGQGPDDILRSIAVIDSQSVAVQAAREGRLAWQRRLAEALHQAADAPWDQLLPLLPEAYRPLVAALVQENSELLLRMRARAQQNYAVLEQSLEILQRFLSTFTSETQPGRPSMEDPVASLEPLRSSS